MTPGPFELAQAIGTQLGGVQRQQRDVSAIDSILSQANQQGTPEAIDNAMSQILSRVSPQNQERALAVLQGKQKQLQQDAQQERILQTAQDKALAEQEKLDAVQTESEILAKVQSGQEITPEERASLSPTSLRTLIGQQKPTFEPTEERLEAERVSTLATEIENDFRAAQSEEMRLGRMEKLDDKGGLATPLMVKTMNVIGLPLGVLGNPDSEEYAKLEADFLRDVRQIFPGGRITNYEIQAYLKTVPGLMNSPDGRKAIIRNRRLMNEAKKLRYDAFREVLSENGGKKPRNMGLLIQDKISERMSQIEDEFSNGISEDSEKFQQPIRMTDANGNQFDIPPGKIEQALQDGFKF